MLSLIGPAMADASKATSGGGFLSSFFPMIFLFAIFYFLLIRPQQKRAKQHKELMASIKRGDKIVTNSGIIGIVAKIANEQEVIIEIAESVFVRFLKSAIADIMKPVDLHDPSNIQIQGQEEEKLESNFAAGDKKDNAKKPTKSVRKAPRTAATRTQKRTAGTAVQSKRKVVEGK
jgi:preprotein translocase subunit YajC